MQVLSRAGFSEKGKISAASDSSLFELGDSGLLVNSQNTVVSASNFEDSGCVVPDDGSCSSFCSCDESGQVVECKFSNEDRETKSYESIVESTPATISEFRYSKEADSPARKLSNKKHRRTLHSAETPSRIEIEVFFAEAEKIEQKRFAEKYNFDIVNDVPLEGRYVWRRQAPAEEALTEERESWSTLRKQARLPRQRGHFQEEETSSSKNLPC